MSRHNKELEEASNWVGLGLVWMLAAILTISILTWLLHSAGVLGSTIVERKVFENSHQYSESRKTEISTLEAQLAEIDVQLDNPDLDADTKRNLQAQKSAINIRLRTAREKYKNVLNN